MSFCNLIYFLPSVRFTVNDNLTKVGTYIVMMATVIMTTTINVENQSPFVGFVAFIRLFIKSFSDGNTEGGVIVTPSSVVVAKL